MRLTLFLLFLAPMLGIADTATSSPLLGRPVVEVIEEYRAAGTPFAYSTNLVREDLIVTEEPEPGDPVPVLRQILRPHGLTIDERAGVFLVVRFDRDGLESGSVLLVITSRGNDEPLAEAAISVAPSLSSSHRIKPGIIEYSGVSPGRYQFSVEAAGFQTVRRVIDVWPGETKVISVDMKLEQPEIETISVSASRYEILRDIAASRFLLDQRTIQTMPDLGEDPVRVVQRLPGAAASGASAKTHFRGGDQGEIGIMLNGVWLFDPYHIRDYQSVFSSIDSRAIEGVEVYTGGFPVRFGNRMSGLVLMESLEALEPRHTEVGLSVFNTSILTAGNESDRRWLFSGRRGNLDLVIDPEFGQPSYYDVFAEFAYDMSPDTTLSINALFADDRVEVILESDPAELERVKSRTRNAQVWARLDNRWSDELSSSTVISAISFENLRRGSLNDEEKIIASVDDNRDIRQFGFRQDFLLNMASRHFLQWGLQVTYSDAEYAYRNSAEYFGLPALFEDQEESISTDLSAAPQGAGYSLYFADRWKPAAKTIIEWGLRWDDQTYTDASADAQLSPRFSALRSVGDNTELRFSWGRYHQSQQINELQIEDGVTRFWPAQRADHLIAGIRHLFRGAYSLRLELFQKDMRQVTPRFENLYDPLSLIPEVMPDRVRLDPSSARSRGLEISIDRSEGPLTWWASYVLSKATDRIGGRDELRSWDQRHAFQGGLGWSNSIWDVSLAASVHSGWPLTELSLVEDGVDEDGEIEYVAVPGLRNAGRHPTFASIDFRLGRKWKLNRGSFLAFLEISNLGNRKNQCCLDWDFEEDEETGEEIFERGVDYWLPLMPAIGVLWEF
jgi:outer membrane receptor protein involved in Fe transport